MIWMIAASSFAQAPDVEKMLAVLDLEIQGLDEQWADTMTRAVMVGVISTGTYTVIDQASRDKIMAEQEFQCSDMAESQCRVQMGKMLGVGRLVMGDIAKPGNSYLVTLQLVRVQTGEILRIEEYRCPCVADDLYEAMKVLAGRLMGIDMEMPEFSTESRASNVSTPTSDPEFEELVKAEQARIIAEKRIGAQRKAMLDSDFNAVKAIHDNVDYSTEAKKMAYEKFLEKWLDDTTYSPTVEYWMKYGDTIDSIMVLIPGGSFMMGCLPGDRDCNDDEKPRHSVTLDSFYMDVNEVTVAQYAACVRAGKCKEPLTKSSDSKYTPYYNWGKSDRDIHPVNGVSWNNATSYCGWKGKRLPTEAEFEYVLRGGQEGMKYPWGDGLTPTVKTGNYADETAKRQFSDWMTLSGYNDGYVGTAPVCSFKKNEYELCDISGNVWEWCSDWYGKDYYSRSSTNNPTGPGSDEFRVLRGGSWSNEIGNLRASNRQWFAQFDSILGFRCVGDGE